MLRWLNDQIVGERLQSDLTPSQAVGATGVWKYVGGREGEGKLVGRLL